MKIRVIIAIGMLMFFACAGKKKLSRVSQFDKIENWVCVYSSDAPVDKIKKFDLAVLDSDFHSCFAKSILT